MRPPTELERLAVFLVAMTVTRLALGRASQPTQARPSGDSYQLTTDERREALLRARALRQQLMYRARYGANNPGAN